VSFSGLLDSFRERKLLVVGDIMLDEYIFGNATRISPEAPVMVIRHRETTRLPGGAANVAKNIAAYGAEVHLIGLAGDDSAGELLREALNAASLPSSLVTSPSRATTRKTRIVADASHQVLRVDQEDDAPIAEDQENELLAAIEGKLPEFDAIVLSDYLKGCISERVARVVHQLAKANWKPVVANPKPASLANYRGATLISLNRSEASEAWGRKVNRENAIQAASELREIHRAEAMVVTMGDIGMAVSGSDSFLVQAPRVEVADPAGAGDTVIATIALGVASAGFTKPIFELAAQAAAKVVGHVGVATVSEEDLTSLRQ